MKFTAVPNTPIQVRLNQALCDKAAKPHFASLHVGAWPVLDINREKIACYQLLNADGKAIASCSVVSGRVEETLAAAYVDIACFHDAALSHFQTAPVFDVTKQIHAA